MISGYTQPCTRPKLQKDAFNQQQSATDGDIVPVAGTAQDFSRCLFKKENVQEINENMIAVPARQITKINL